MRTVGSFFSVRPMRFLPTHSIPLIIAALGILGIILGILGNILRGRYRVHDLRRGCGSRGRRHLAHLAVPTPTNQRLGDRHGLLFRGGAQPAALLHVGGQRLPGGLQGKGMVRTKAYLY